MGEKSKIQSPQRFLYSMRVRISSCIYPSSSPLLSFVGPLSLQEREREREREKNQKIPCMSGITYPSLKNLLTILLLYINTEEIILWNKQNLQEIKKLLSL
jgi:hypothetical protein